MAAEMASEGSVPPTAVSIGTFDGVHLGHQTLLNRTHEHAQSRGLTSVALTFRRPPQNELGHPKPLLLPPKEKLAVLGEFVDRVGVLDFQRIRHLEPEAFVDQILHETYRARVIVTGSDFRFGRDRQGDVDALRSLGDAYGMTVEVVEPVDAGGRSISSTAIRQLLQEGRIRDAAALLGRSPRLVGEVVTGAGEGAKLGFPTANLHIDPEVLIPADGIYAAWANLNGERQPSALYIGRRPTYNAQERSVEAHLLTPPARSLRQCVLKVDVVERVRPDERFASLEALKAQMATDVAEIRDILAAD